MPIVNIKIMIRTFGVSAGEIFDTLEVKEKAKAFAESVVGAAEKVGQSKVKTEEMRSGFRSTVKAGLTLGNSPDKRCKAQEETKCGSPDPRKPSINFMVPVY